MAIMTQVNDNCSTYGVAASVVSVDNLKCTTDAEIDHLHHRINDLEAKLASLELLVTRPIITPQKELRPWEL